MPGLGRSGTGWCPQWGFEEKGLAPLEGIVGIEEKVADASGGNSGKWGERS